MIRAGASFLILGALACVLGGCAKCGEPIIKTEIQKVYIPVKCGEMPIKPQYDGSLESAKDLAAYYKKCETILRECLK